MTAKLTQQEYRESVAGKTKAASLLSTAIGGNGKLKAHKWSDEELSKIPNEELARLAYEQSTTLPKEFIRCEAFLSYWRGVQRQKG